MNICTLSDTLKRLLNLLLVTVSCFYLIACVSNTPKASLEPVAKKEVGQYIVVDSDVQQDFSKAIILLQQNNNEQAAAVLKSVIEREQRLPAPYVNLAIAQNRLGDPKSAKENLIKALKIDITHPVANNELGLLYRKEGEFNAARTAYENAIQAHTDYLPARKNLGVLCDLYLHDFDCALEQFENYLELKPDDKTVAIWVADVKRRIGN